MKRIIPTFESFANRLDESSMETMEHINTFESFLNELVKFCLKKLFLYVFL